MPADPTDPDQPLYGAAPLTAYARFWRRYVVFSGRASLSEYWWSVLINWIGCVAFGVSAVGAFVTKGGVTADAVAATAGTFVGAVCFFLASSVVLPKRHNGSG